MDLISVVIPVYNVEAYLDRCLESVVNQTYQNLEIILVDDGSPDRCPQMCDAWARKDNRIKVIHKENEGLGMARNTGIEHATGSYICFFDSDDYVELETIEKAVSLSRKEQADIVIFGMSVVQDYQKIKSQIVPKATKTCFQGEQVQDQLLPCLIEQKCKDNPIKDLCLSACCCLFSADLIRRTNWKFVSERQNISEDSYSLIWLYKYVSKVAILPEALYCYFVNVKSLSRSYRTDRFEKNKMFYADTLAMAEEQGYNDAVSHSISGLFLGFTIAAMKQIVASELDPLCKRKFLSEIIRDDVVQNAMKAVAHRQYGLARKVLFFAIRHRCVDLCWLLIMAQNLKS